MVGSVDPVGKQCVPLALCAYWVTEARSEGIFAPNFLNRMKKQILSGLLLFTKKKKKKYACSKRYATVL